MKIVAALSGGLAFYLVCYWLASRYGVVWLFGALTITGLILTL